MSQIRYVAVRFAQTVFLLWFILTFLFFFFRLMPGSYVDLMLFSGASEETVETFRQQWGLNQPLYVQYGRYLTNFVQGDLGTSVVHRQPVWEVVGVRIFNTLILVGPAITTAYVLSAIIGTVIGNRRGTLLERFGVVSIITVGAFPSFFTAIVLVLVFAAWLGVFPTSGMISPGTASQFADSEWWRMYLTRDFAWHYVLPFAAIVIRYLYEPTIIMRTSVVEVSGQDFMQYHKLTGLPYAQRMRHLGKHSILPLVTLYPISMARAISGLVLIELVFNWPGIGFTLVEAVLSRDTPVVQFVFFLTAAFVVISNFLVDIAYGIVDPRVSVADS
jgi:peptide/nickel transport system permease protein